MSIINKRLLTNDVSNIARYQVNILRKKNYCSLNAENTQKEKLLPSGSPSENSNKAEYKQFTDIFVKKNLSLFDDHSR